MAFDACCCDFDIAEWDTDQVLLSSRKVWAKRRLYALNSVKSVSNDFAYFFLTCPKFNAIRCATSYLSNYTMDSICQICVKCVI